MWGGGGDRIGVGGGPTVAGSDLWGYSTTIAGAAIEFGSNDTVVATSYDTMRGTASINSILPGASSARVTIGGAAGTLDVASDAIFYPNESPQTDQAIVATAQSANGGTGSMLTLPDGTAMTLFGVTPAQFQGALAAGTLFKA